MLAGPGQWLAVDLAVAEQVPLKSFQDWFGDNFWRAEIAVDAPQREGFYIECSFLNGGFGEVVNGQPCDMRHEQLVEASWIFSVAEGFYDMVGITVGSGHRNLSEVRS